LGINPFVIDFNFQACGEDKVRCKEGRKEEMRASSLGEEKNGNTLGT
jgi:hypothetical protein